MKPGLTALLVVVAMSAVVVAQDPVKVDPTHYKVVVDNAAVRVLRVNYAAGAKGIMHQHPDSIVVPLVAAKVRFTMADGKTEDADMPNESAKYSAAGTHNPANLGAASVDALLIEFKRAGGKAVLPTARPGMSMTILAEGPRAMAYRTTAAPTFAEPAGTKHDYDQIVISLGPSAMSLSVAGGAPRTTWARGDAVFIGRGIAHEAKNTGAKPVDFIVIAIK